MLVCDIAAIEAKAEVLEGRNVLGRAVMVELVTESLLLSLSLLNGWDEDRAGREAQVSTVGTAWVGA